MVKLTSIRLVRMTAAVYSYMYQYQEASLYLFVNKGADLGGGVLGARAPLPLIPHFEAQIFATDATQLRDVGKISLGPRLTQILDPHLLLSF